MLNSAKSFLNIPIVSLYNTSKIGSLLDFIVDPEQGKAVGIVGEKSGIFKKRVKVISVVDIRELSKEAIVVDNEDVLVSPNEIVKIDSILKQGIKIFNNKVVTEAGKFLGRVSDFLIDDLFYLVKILVNPSLTNIFTTQLIISRDSILAVTKDEIIVKNDLEGIKEDVEVAEAA